MYRIRLFTLIKPSSAKPPLHPSPFPLLLPHCLLHRFPPRRPLHLPTALAPPLIFTALLLVLWSYKCVMLVLFQNRIIYMPSMPPFSRSERIADYAPECRPVVWREERISAVDGTGLAVAMGEMAVEGEEKKDVPASEGGERRVVVLYFQGYVFFCSSFVFILAPFKDVCFRHSQKLPFTLLTLPSRRNGSSLPPRLPALSSILKLLHQPPSPVTTSTPSSTSTPPPSPPPPTIYTILALSYRGYWTSTGRPSEPGLILDAQAILAYAARTYPPSPTTRFVLWGQSLGASVALTAATPPPTNASNHNPPAGPPIHGIILETPFLSIRAMLLALYPQKWLPYRYLAPFLRNHWDSEAALRRLALASTSASTPKILILQASRDELVPPAHALAIERLCLDLGFVSKSGPDSSFPPPSDQHSADAGEVHRIEIGGAFHTDVLSKAQGRRAVVGLLREV